LRLSGLLVAALLVASLLPVHMYQAQEQQQPQLQGPALVYTRGLAGLTPVGAFRGYAIAYSPSGDLYAVDMASGSRAWVASLAALAGRPQRLGLQVLEVGRHIRLGRRRVGGGVERAYKAYKRLVEELGARFSRDRLVMAHVNKIVSALSLPGHVAAKAYELVEELRWGFPATKDAVVAAALVYLAASSAGVRVTLEALSRASGVSTVAIRSAVEKLGKVEKEVAGARAP